MTGICPMRSRHSDRPLGRKKSRDTYEKYGGQVRNLIKISIARLMQISSAPGPVAELVEIEGSVVPGAKNFESPGVRAADTRPRQRTITLMRPYCSLAPMRRGVFRHSNRSRMRCDRYAHGECWIPVRLAPAMRRRPPTEPQALQKKARLLSTRVPKGRTSLNAVYPDLNLQPVESGDYSQRGREVWMEIR